MSEKLIKLSADEMVKLDKLFRKSKREAILTAAGVAIVLFIFCVIPSGLANLLSGTSPGTNNHDDPDQSLIQLWGFGTWFIVFTYLIFLGKKIFQLKKDLKEGEKMELDVVVTNKYADDKNGNYFMRVNSDTLKNKKIILAREQFNQFNQNQKLTIDVYKNSMILVSNSV